ncbi:hypothetical protein RIF29_35134 [Crotalaria pallida]|uniref:Xylanase inhibitor C-terminal domain-containing protein n=1 Tax=Crotalaria pallida TaxID=3830 RepID=A0AAN9HTW0_CROPI
MFRWTNHFHRIYFRSHYNVYLQSISVDGQMLQIDPAVFATSSNTGAMIDYGTSLAYFPKKAYISFVDAIEDVGVEYKHAMQPVTSTIATVATKYNMKMTA